MSPSPIIGHDEVLVAVVCDDDSYCPGLLRVHRLLFVHSLFRFAAKQIRPHYGGACTILPEREGASWRRAAGRLTFWTKLHLPRSTITTFPRTAYVPSSVSQASPAYWRSAVIRPGGSTIVPNHAGEYMSWKRNGATTSRWPMFGVTHMPMQKHKTTRTRPRRTYARCDSALPRSPVRRCASTALGDAASPPPRSCADMPSFNGPCKRACRPRSVRTNTDLASCKKKKSLPTNYTGGRGPAWGCG